MDLSQFYPLSLLDQNFGLCISPQDIIFPSYTYRGSNYYRPWKWYLQRPEKDFGSTIQNEKDKFKITLDVQHFQPSEINVKVADKEVIIEGKHEEKKDSLGFISRQFRRRYFLPPDCIADSVVSSLSSDGVLIVTADKSKDSKTKEIIVPIKRCETCPNKELLKAGKTEVKVEDKVKEDSKQSKKNMEIMLKEDHCCILKPELLGAPSAAVAAQKVPENTKKNIDELLKITSVSSGQASSLDVKPVKLDATCGQSTSKTEIEAASTAAAKSELCSVKSTIQESTTIQESSTSSTSMASSIQETSDKISEIVSDISAQLKEAAENI